MKVKNVLILSIIAIMSFIYTGFAEGVKNDNIVNVVDYGANGKDEADDLEAIQKALNKGGTDKTTIVKIPSGKYYIKGTLKIKSNTYLKLDKDVEIIKTSKTGPMIKNYNLGNEKYGEYKANKNITIQGGTWDGNKELEKTQGFSNILIGHSENITIKEANVINNYGGHLIEFAGVKDGKIVNCNLSGYEGTQAKEAIQLDVIIDERNSPGMKPYDKTICKDIEITNNEIKNFSRGIGSHMSYEGKFNTDILINKNNISNIINEGVNAYNFKNLKIIENKFSNIGVGIEFKTQSTNLDNDYITQSLSDNYGLVIEKNDIRNINPKKIKPERDNLVIYGSGIRVLGSGGDGRNLPIEGTKIIGNTIDTRRDDGTADDGIYLTYNLGAKIESNTINSDKYGIQINNSSGNDIINNTIESSKQSGIAINKNSKSNIIEKNTIKNSNKHGIQVWDNSSTKKLNNNNIYDSLQNGISVSVMSECEEIKENKIYSSKKHGISIYDNSVSNIESNIIDKSKEHGISVSKECKNNNISLNKISNSEKQGISIHDNSQSNIQKNIIDKSKGHGIYINKACEVKNIFKNEIYSSNKNGIFINDKSKAKVEENYVSNSKDKNYKVLNSESNIEDIDLFKINTITDSITKITGNIIKKGTLKIEIDKHKYDANVDQNGDFESEKIPYLKYGNIVKFIISDEYKNSIEVEEKVQKSIKSITLSKTNAKLKIDEYIELVAKISPVDPINKELYWETDKPEVAIVDQNGNVKAISSGKAKITVTATEGTGKATCDITVLGNTKPEIVVKDQTIKKNAKFDPKTIVKVNDIEDGDLTSNIKISGKVDTSKVGSYKITYSVVDSDGNKVSKTITVKVIEDSFKTFTVSNIDKNSKTITGKGLKGASVKAYVNKKQIGKTATVDSKGNYKISIPKQGAGKEVVIKISKSGYKSKEIKTKVLNVFSKFTVNNVTYKSKSISGNGNSGSTITAYVKDKKIASTKASKDKYKMNIKQQKKGTKIKIKITKSGYKTIEKTITVK